MEEGEGGAGVYPLLCTAKQYDWGKLGKESAVAELLRNQSGAAAIKDEERYAELWMGTHPSGPSSVKVGAKTVPLHEFLKGNKALLGKSVLSLEDS